MPLLTESAYVNDFIIIANAEEYIQRNPSSRMIITHNMTIITEATKVTVAEG